MSSHVLVFGGGGRFWLCFYVISVYFRRVLRYQRGNQNPYIEEQTTQWPKGKVQKDKQRYTKHTYKTKDLETRTPLKTGGELRCSGRVSSSCSNSVVFFGFSFYQYIFNLPNILSMYLLGQPIVQMKYRDVQTEFGHNKVLTGISVDILQLEILVKWSFSSDYCIICCWLKLKMVANIE